MSDNHILRRGHHKLCGLLRLNNCKGSVTRSQLMSLIPQAVMIGHYIGHFSFSHIFTVDRPMDRLLYTKPVMHPTIYYHYHFNIKRALSRILLRIIEQVTHWLSLQVIMRPGCDDRGDYDRKHWAARKHWYHCKNKALWPPESIGVLGTPFWWYHCDRVPVEHELSSALLSMSNSRAQSGRRTSLILSTASVDEALRKGKGSVWSTTPQRAMAHDAEWKSSWVDW